MPADSTGWHVGTYDESDVYRIDEPGEGDFVTVLLEVEDQFGHAEGRWMQTVQHRGKAGYDTDDNPVEGLWVRWRHATPEEIAEFEALKAADDALFAAEEKQS